MSPSTAFLSFWLTDRTRNTFLSTLPKEDLASFRLVCHDFSDNATPFLFNDLSVQFHSTTFTKHSRLMALQRIGQHVKTFIFNIPHSAETFLPPLIDSDTGEEVAFVYEPYTQTSKDPHSRLSMPSYGSWEMTDLLVRQYPPLFHAAANVPSFIKALSMVPNLKHLEICCPNREPNQRYRRSIVDYALISIRMAVERNKLPSLDTLSLIDVHPATSLYMNPIMGFGALPNSLRRWKQIRTLRIRMDSTYPAGSAHLKHLHSYLSIFTPSLRNLDFQWLGDRYPLPVTLNAGSSSKRSDSPSIKPLRFSRLRQLNVENTIADASQIARFIARHHRAVKHTKRLKLDFNDTLLSKGTWDEALEPLTHISGSESWKSSSEESWSERSAEESVEEFMDVPIMFSPVDAKQEQLHRVWDDHVRTRTSKQHYSGMASLQRAGARTKELLFGTEEHMRKLFSSTVLGWR